MQLNLVYTNTIHYTSLCFSFLQTIVVYPVSLYISFWFFKFHFFFLKILATLSDHKFFHLPFPRNPFTITSYICFPNWFSFILCNQTKPAYSFSIVQSIFNHYSLILDHIPFCFIILYLPLKYPISIQCTFMFFVTYPTFTWIKQKQWMAMFCFYLFTHFIVLVEIYYFSNNIYMP